MNRVERIRILPFCREAVNFARFSALQAVEGAAEEALEELFPCTEDDFDECFCSDDDYLSFIEELQPKGMFGRLLGYSDQSQEGGVAHLLANVLYERAKSRLRFEKPGRNAAQDIGLAKKLYQTADVLALHGWIALLNQNHKLALVDADRALHLDKTHVNASRVKSIALRSSRQPCAANLAVSCILPSTDLGLLERCLAQLAKGEALKAQADVTKALELRESSDAYICQGLCRFELGKAEEAMLAYDKALDLDPKNVDVVLHKADLNLFLGNFNEALRAYDQSGAWDDPKMRSTHKVLSKVLKNAEQLAIDYQMHSSAQPPGSSKEAWSHANLSFDPGKGPTATIERRALTLEKVVEIAQRESGKRIEKAAQNMATQELLLLQQLMAKVDDMSKDIWTIGPSAAHIATATEATNGDISYEEMRRLMRQEQNLAGNLEQTNKVLEADNAELREQLRIASNRPTESDIALLKKIHEVEIEKAKNAVTLVREEMRVTQLENEAVVSDKDISIDKVHRQLEMYRKIESRLVAKLDASVEKFDKQAKLRLAAEDKAEQLMNDLEQEVAERATVVQANTDLSEQIRNLTIDKRQLDANYKASLAKIRTETQESTNMLIQLQVDLDRQRDMLRHAEEELADMRDQNNQLRSELETTKIHVVEARSSASAHQELDKVLEHLGQARKRWEQEVDARLVAESELRRTEDRVVDLQRDLKHSEIQCAKLQSRLDNAQKQAAPHSPERKFDSSMPPGDILKVVQGLPCLESQVRRVAQFEAEATRARTLAQTERLALIDADAALAEVKAEIQTLHTAITTAKSSKMPLAYDVDDAVSRSAVESVFAELQTARCQQYEQKLRSFQDRKINLEVTAESRKEKVTSLVEQEAAATQNGLEIMASIADLSKHLSDSNSRSVMELHNKNAEIEKLSVTKAKLEKYLIILKDRLKDEKHDAEKSKLWEELEQERLAREVIEDEYIEYQEEVRDIQLTIADELDARKGHRI